MKKIFYLALLAVTTISNLNAQTSKYQDIETQQLIKTMSNNAKSGKVMFGVANGVSRNFAQPFAVTKIEGDCKQITGKDPQFVENDFLFYRDKNFWNQEMVVSKEFVKNGGLIGYCWHLNGPESKNFRKNDLDDQLVEKIISDQPTVEKEWFISLIDTLLVPTFKSFDCPVLFRPFHEMNGGWFWWGSSTITSEQYIKLYRMTVDRIREKGVRNVIYTWSPDTRLATEYYPGDDYVDIVGLDAYEPGCSPYHGNEIFAIEMNKLLKFANEHHKIPTIAETGLREIEGVYYYPEQIPDFWTSKVWNAITDKNGKGNGLAYVLSWYNADWAHNGNGPAYIPYKGFEKRFGEKGKQAIEDFKKFSTEKNIIFLGDFKNNIYGKN